MTSTTRTLAAAAAVLAMGAGAALGKAHDQGSGPDGDPGANVFSETVMPAQGLGAALGNADNPNRKDARTEAE